MLDISFNLVFNAIFIGENRNNLSDYLKLKFVMDEIPEFCYFPKRSNTL